ncbi:MAG: putative phosphoglycerate mutase [Parcubacteria group bacterium Gr01-1014_31]|nr:MAG: putative phosphoglycerate mutase [Parcubacteria group bacterium Gr01-1014_31]
MQAIIHTDGGARGNPGPAGVGVVIEVGGKTHHFKKFIGHATNNQAEYLAVLLALEEAEKLRLQELQFYLDSELVVRQLNQEYKIKDAELGRLFVKIWNLRSKFKLLKFAHVPRERNKEADRLVNEAIDSGA